MRALTYVQMTMKMMLQWKLKRRKRILIGSLATR